MSILKKFTIISILFLLLSVFVSVNAGIIEVNASTPTIGTEYTTVSVVPAPVNTTLGTPTKIAGSNTSYQEFQVSNNVFWTHARNYDDYSTEYVVIHQFPKKVNMTIARLMSSFRYLSSGVTYSYSVTHTAGETFSYEQSATVSLTTSYENTTTLTVNGLDYGSVGEEVSLGVESTVSATVSYSHIMTYTSTISESFQVSPPLSSYYMFETRGMFIPYVVQVLEIEYSSVKTHHGLPGILGYDTWVYTVSKYILSEQYVLYGFVPDTAATGLYKYIWNGSRFVYNDSKYTGVVYY